MARASNGDLPDGARQYFHSEDWTGRIILRLLTKSAFTRAPFSRHRAIVDGFDLGEKPHHFALIEQMLRPCRSNAREWRLIEQPRLHHALVRQVLDDHVNKLDLRGRCGATREKFAERLTNSGAIKPQERTD